MEKYFLLSTLELAALQLYFKSRKNGYKIDKVETAHIEEYRQVFLTYSTGAAVVPNKAMNMQVGVFVGMAMQRYQKQLKQEFPDKQINVI